MHQANQKYKSALERACHSCCQCSQLRMSYSMFPPSVDLSDGPTTDCRKMAPLETHPHNWLLSTKQDQNMYTCWFQIPQCNAASRPNLIPLALCTFYKNCTHPIWSSSALFCRQCTIRSFFRGKDYFRRFQSHRSRHIEMQGLFHHCCRHSRCRHPVCKTSSRIYRCSK